MTQPPETHDIEGARRWLAKPATLDADHALVEALIADNEDACGALYRLFNDAALGSHYVALLLGTSHDEEAARTALGSAP